MQVRICVQNFDNGDVQGFLYIDEGSGEVLASTSPRYAAGTPSASFFSMSGNTANIDAEGDVDVDNRVVTFGVTYMGSMTPSIFKQPLTVSSASC